MTENIGHQQAEMGAAGSAILDQRSPETPPPAEHTQPTEDKGAMQPIVAPSA